MPDYKEDFTKNDTFPVLRPWTHFERYRQDEFLDESWLGKVKRNIWDATVSFANLSDARHMFANMLFEVWNEKRFFSVWGKHDEGTPDDVDRLFLIQWLQHVSTYTGLLTFEEVKLIRTEAENFESTIGAQQDPLFLPTQFLAKSKFDNSLELNYLAIKQKARKKPKPIIRGLFLGSFDPPHIYHLLPAIYYRQFCHELFIGLDNDKFISYTKSATREADRESFDIQTRLAVWKNFPHAYDQLFQIPINVILDADREFPKLFRNLKIDIVFLPSYEHNLERRVKQVVFGGAKPFVGGIDFTETPYFSSSLLMKYVKRGISEPFS